MNDDKISRYLSYILRHNPNDLPIEMDKNGWVNVDKLVSGIISKKQLKFTREDLDRIVETDSKGRYEYGPDKVMIRACQGHSIKNVDLEFEEVIPPLSLYHGTSDRFLNAIQRVGIKPQTRQYVHLSSTMETAREVGSRHGLPVVIRIDARKMYKDGIKFYRSKNGVWLTEIVKPEYFKNICVLKEYHNRLKENQNE